MAIGRYALVSPFTYQSAEAGANVGIYAVTLQGLNTSCLYILGPTWPGYLTSALILVRLV